MTGNAGQREPQWSPQGIIQLGGTIQGTGTACGGEERMACKPDRGQGAFGQYSQAHGAARGDGTGQGQGLHSMILVYPFEISSFCDSGASGRDLAPSNPPRPGKGHLPRKIHQSSS